MTVTTPSVDETAIDELKAEVRGPVLQSEDDDYDEARTVYNAMIDRLPGIIVRPIGAADITTPSILLANRTFWLR